MLVKRKGKMLKLVSHKGYLVVNIGNPARRFGVHQVVAMAFHGPCPDGFEVDHVSTVKTDNRPSNLEYVTSSENVKRQYRTGLLSNKGETNGRCKLTDEQVALIRSLNGVWCAARVAREFGVSTTHVHRLWKRQLRADIAVSA